MLRRLTAIGVDCTFVPLNMAAVYIRAVSQTLFCAFPIDSVTCLVLMLTRKTANNGIKKLPQYQFYWFLKIWSVRTGLQGLKLGEGVILLAAQCVHLKIGS